MREKLKICSEKSFETPRIGFTYSSHYKRRINIGTPNQAKSPLLSRILSTQSQGDLMGSRPHLSRQLSAL